MNDRPVPQPYTWRISVLCLPLGLKYGRDTPACIRLTGHANHLPPSPLGQASPSLPTPQISCPLFLPVNPYWYGCAPDSLGSGDSSLTPSQAELYFLKAQKQMVGRGYSFPQSPEDTPLILEPHPKSAHPHPKLTRSLLVSLGLGGTIINLGDKR